MKLQEIVPFAQSHSIEKGLVQKHGIAAYGPGTFGVEIEFAPSDGKVEEDYSEQILTEVDSDTIVTIIERYGEASRRFANDYIDWLYQERKLLNRRAHSYGWDDTYGPPADDEWADMFPEPEPARDEENNITDDYREWSDKKTDAEWEYKKWERNDSDNYKSDFVVSLKQNIFDYIDVNSMMEVLRSRYSREYPSFANVSGIVIRQNIRDVIEFLEDEMMQTVADSPSEKNWDVGPDGDNVEIRSRHLTKEDFKVVGVLFEWLARQGYDMNPSTSAHVHVGLPNDFDAFSLLALMTLVDEKEVKAAVGKRNLDDWAKLRDNFERKVSDKIAGFLKNQNTPSVRFSKEKLLELLKSTAEKFSGTNIRSFWNYNTVEFRYFGSNISNVNTFISWIKYFMLLPIVAKTRREVKVGNVYFKKLEDGSIVATTDRTIKVEPNPKPERPIDKLKAKKLANMVNQHPDIADFDQN